MDLFSRLTSPAASSYGEAAHQLTLSLLGLAVFFTLAVYGAVVYLAWKYRKGSPASRESPPSHDWRLEALWIGVPVLLALGIFAWSSSIYYSLFNPVENAYQIYVLGKQWMWKAYHTSGRAEINEIHLPVGRPVVLILGSQDVVHSLFVPDFRVKMDAVPGKFTRIWFTPLREGRYPFFCTQYCGTDHSVMRGEVVVLKPEEMDTWTNAERAPEVSGVVGGERVYHRLGCESCHSPFRTDLAPTLKGLYMHKQQLASGRLVAVDDEYIRRSILSPNQEVTAGYDPVMPSFAGRLSEDELVQLILYLRTL